MRAIALMLAACTGSGHDVVGPFGGVTYRLAVDAITLPRSSPDIWAFGDDLTGDRSIDNLLGDVTLTLFDQNDLSLNGADMIGSGVIASRVEIVANDLTDDPTVAVTYFGADGDPLTGQMGGRMFGGAFRSNRTFDTHAPGQAHLRLPVLADADPVEFVLDGAEIDLAPDGRGGYNALIRGGVLGEGVLPAVLGPIKQMLAANPAEHRDLATALDGNGD